MQLIPSTTDRHTSFPCSISPFSTITPHHVNFWDLFLQKATVDGATVLSKSGRLEPDWMNRLPWMRPTDEGYQVHVTESGMDVRLGERTVWGIKANEWLG